MDSLETNQIFADRFEILSQLGAGGMGCVYLAEQLDARRQVAIKLIHSYNADSQDDRDRFLRECKILSSLSHKNIVTLYSAAIERNGIIYSVSEYIKGKSLRELLNQEEKLSWQRLRNIVLQICDGMSYAHAHSVVHRDLKPANIMLVDKPEPDTVKIIDFGLALNSNPDSGGKLTATGALIGSPHYMSPEQALGKTAGPGSDIYALGCIIFECLIGKKLFDADTAIGIVHLQANQDAASQIDAAFSGEAAAFLKKMLDKKPETRFQSMREISDLIQESLIHINVKDEKGKYKAAVRLKSAGAVLLIILALGVILLAWHFQAKPKRSAIFISKSTVQDGTTKDIKTLKGSIQRIESRFSRGPADERQPTGELLLSKLHELEMSLVSSNSPDEIAESEKTCEKELAVRRSLGAGYMNGVGPCYVLMAKGALKLGDLNKSALAFAEAEKIILEVNGPTSGQFHDLVLERFPLKIKLRKFAEARADLQPLFDGWSEHIQQVGVYHSKVLLKPLLNRDGPDREVLLTNCLKEVRSAHPSSLQESAQLSALENLLGSECKLFHSLQYSK